MEPEPKQRRKSSKAAGNTLLAVPFALFGFTAAMIHIPGEGQPPRAPQILAEKGIARDAAAAVVAAAEDDIHVLRLLSKCGLDMDSPAEHGVTPLMAAARANAPDAMRWLIRTGQVKLEPTDESGLSALAHAVVNGHTDRVEELAAAGAYPGALATDKQLPIVTVAASDDLRMLRTLFNLGERAGLPEAIDSALRDRRLVTADFLLTHQTEHGIGDPTAQRATLLHQAVETGDADTVTLLLQHQAPLGVTGAAGNTPLGTALGRGDLETADLLLRAGAPIESPCARDLAPLHLAWQKRDEKTAEFLLKRGAAPLPVLVSAAAEAGEFGFVHLLARFGAPLDLPLGDGDTMLARALSNGDYLRANDLLAIGASPSALTREGQSALAVAVARRDAVAVRMLLDAGADPDLVLEHPVSDTFHEIVDAKNLSYYLKRDRRFTPLMVAAGTGDGDVIRALLAGGASKGKYTRSWKRYPISFASSANHILAQQLLCGYDPAEHEDQFKMVIDLSTQRATLYKNDQPVNSSTVSTGMKGYRTPTGEYVVTHKHKDHKSTLYDSAPMPYFMRFSCGAFGTHTGNCPGYPASHGCIRMPNHKAKAFFYAAPTGTPVSIVP
jgi:ankyrin repeat protein